MMRFMDDWRRRREYARRGAALDEDLAQQTDQYPEAARMADEGLAAERMIREDDEANWRRLRLMPVPVSSSVNLSPAGAPAGRAMNLMAPGMTPQRYDAEFGVNNQATHDANMLKMGRAPGDAYGGSVQARERRVREYLDRQSAEPAAVRADELARTRSRDQVEAARAQGADAEAIRAAGNVFMGLRGSGGTDKWGSAGGGVIFNQRGDLKGVNEPAHGPVFQGNIITDPTTGIKQYWDGKSYKPIDQKNRELDPIAIMAMGQWVSEATDPVIKKERSRVMDLYIRQSVGGDAAGEIRNFNSIEEVEASGLPRGTEIILQGRRAKID